MATSRTSARERQREATRERILEAAVAAFAEKGFPGASTREIARRAGTNQGLITYHFRSKEELWRAAADSIFERLGGQLAGRLEALELADPRERAREAIREYVRFAAAHPELFRIMVDEGRVADDRMKWLVDAHLRPRFEAISRGLIEVAGIDEALLPHAFYALAGAASLIFAVAPECRRLTGLDPRSAPAIETHADYVARLLVPEAARGRPCPGVEARGAFRMTRALVAALVVSAGAALAGTWVRSPPRGARQHAASGLELVA